jgi:transcriptional regulator with XRE-family HTH domain
MPSLTAMSKRVAHGPAIRAIRELLGVSVSAFAPRADCTQGYMSNVELGKKQPTIEFLARVARELGVSIDAVSYVIPDCEHEDAVA